LCPHSDTALEDPAAVLSVGDRTLALSGNQIWAVRDDATVKKLSQTGTLPAGGIDRPIFGPAGLIVAGDDGNTYFGVPA
jgi:hypothetical protein